MRYLLITALPALIATPLCAQPSNFDFLRRMDANHNGRLEASEISDRARPYLERFTRDAGIRLSGSVSLSQLESAARRYYERRGHENSDRHSTSTTRSFATSSSAPESITGVRGFGPDDDTLLVPGFGPDVDIRYPFTGPDEEKASETLRRYDENRDGGIDRAEAKRGRWSDNPFVYDINDDGLLSLIELAQRYARRRVAEASGGRSDSQSSRSDDRSRDSGHSSDRGREYGDRREGDPRSNGGPASTGRPDRRTYELAYSIVARHDRNRNGNLDRPEWTAAGENISQADADRNGQITRGELATWLAEDIQRKYKDFSGELPGWFFELDANEDRQISMSEFTQDWNSDKLTEFSDFDRNGDGFLTEKELLESKSAIGGTYANEKAIVIMPVGTVASDIFVDDDYLIGDIDIKLSITHTNDEQLNAYLIGPDQQRIELFTGVGRSDDHFDGTILDDEATERITRSHPPFHGHFLPEGKEKNGPSLSHFYNKSVHGLWQLEIRTSRGDRPGMLHGWSLIVRRPDELDSEARQDEEPATDSRERPSAHDPPTRDDRERPRSFGEGRFGGPPSFGAGDPSARSRYSFGGERQGGERPTFRGGPHPRGRGPGDR